MTLDLNLKQLLQYEAWANREALVSLEGAGPAAPQRALGIMAHVVGASRLWLARLQQQPSELAVWPALDISGMRRELDHLEQDWQAYSALLTPPGLEGRITYVNSRGERWQNAVHDILTHLLLHSAYHRGQIATLLGHAGKSAASTDFIHAVRQGLV
jgi:uncharacterized damage-inducible protein DinB